MVFSKSVGKTLFLYTDQADITDFSVKRREELCPLRGVRVQNISNLDLEKAMEFSATNIDKICPFMLISLISSRE